MSLNVNKTKVMVMSREGNVQCEIKLNQVVLEQVNRYKYLGSWITEDVRCESEIVARIAMAKTAFWQNKKLVKSTNEVLKRMYTELHFRKDMWKRKMEFAGHVLRGSSGNAHLRILEKKICGKRFRGRPRLTWTDDVMKWTTLKLLE